MELFFDTYEAKNEKDELVPVEVDVREYTGPIVRLLDKLPQTQAPPILLFSMGRFQFRCVLVDAGQRFTMFLPSGTPVRSIMSVRFQEYVRADIEIQRGLFFGSPTVSAVVNTAVETGRSLLSGSPTVHITLAGDTLSGLAAAYLGDAALWRDIAQANNIDDPFNLLVGLPLVIPARGLSQLVRPARG
jgi:nucleoid-associated protein YgaU